MKTFDDLGLSVAEQLERSVGPFVALPAFKGLLPQILQGSSCARAALGALRCAVKLGNEKEIEELSERYTLIMNGGEHVAEEHLPNPWVALAPLVVVGVGNLVFLQLIPALYGASHEFQIGGMTHPVSTNVTGVTAIWAVQAALILGILTVLAFAWKPVTARFAEGTKAAVAGSLLASMNTASEYGFGGVIASLPGFVAIADLLKEIPNPLVNQAITVNVLAGITGSASGGMSIALAAMADRFKEAATAAGIDFQVLHRVASMASGGMDTLPHNGAVITLLAVTGLSHRQSYGDIFAITCIKTASVFFIIAVYYLTGLV